MGSVKVTLEQLLHTKALSKNKMTKREGVMVKRRIK
jgi:hypothetical protein